MDRSTRWIAATLLLAASLTAGSAEQAPRLLILAGSASKPVLTDALPALRTALGVEIDLDLGGSGSLLSRLELTHRGDIYLPGSHDFLERAIARDLVDPATRTELAWLAPALLVRRGNPRGITSIADLARPEIRAAIGEPRTVCVGLYARELVQRAGLERSLLPRLGRARSCAALANLLAMGSVDGIIGWRVFEAWFPDRVEAHPLPPGLRPRLATVPGAVTRFSARPALARRVLAWLAGDAGREIWRRHGYLTSREQAQAWLEQSRQEPRTR
ncbi:MAG: substrate-binding domain-containing protein [Acidobacteriota bacterium]|nr:substrate-binding domain-containing protein [Acidobacteriota bacterium]MDQ7088353.1 substrate-binding domain-containing protein [Acidobacteriota bacterium]